jgi:ABC-2 type transport system permease protein
MADVSLTASLGMILVFLTIGVAMVAWMFRSGYRLRP